MLKVLFYLFITCLPFLAFCQNLVMNVKGGVYANSTKGLIPLKKGDNVPNTLKLKLLKDKDNPNPEIKLLTPKGISLIRLDNFQNNGSSELIDLIKSSIHSNSVATLGTRSLNVNPSVHEQLIIVDSLCKVLRADKTNINYIVANYINPFCVSEFVIPFWFEIQNLLNSKYEYRIIKQTGSIISSEEFSKIPKVANAISRNFLPTSFSLKKYCPIPGNQGNFGTCVGWSSAYGARTISWAIKNNFSNTNDITNQAFSPTYIYENVKNILDYNCSNGASLFNAVNILKTKGVPYKSDINDNCNINVDAFNKNASNYAIKDYQALTDRYGLSRDDREFDQNLKNIKRAISEKKPVLASILCYDSFEGKIWNGITDINRGGHALCIIGYDDNFSNGDGAVEILNSWGPFWGNGGFIHVKYSDLKKILTSAISIYDDLKMSPLFPPISEEKNDTLIPPIVIDTLIRMSGSFSLQLNDGLTMPIESDIKGVRGLKLTQVENVMYNVSQSYPSGTLFRIKFTSNEPCYVYVIGSDSKKSPIAQLFPDTEKNISALLDFKSEVSVTIPDGDMFIQMDDNAGEDYLCVIYSKNELNIQEIRKKIDNSSSKSFVKVVKESLSKYLVDEKEVTFQKNSIAFSSISKDKTAVPIFIKIKHH